MDAQHTSDAVKPVSRGLARHMGIVFEGFSENYPGGSAKLDLVKGDPKLEDAYVKFLDERAAIRRAGLYLETLEPWREILVRVYNSPNHLLKVVRRVARVEDSAWTLMQQYELPDLDLKYDLYTAPVHELITMGVESWSNLGHILEANGFSYCPPEIGPQLREDWKLQNPGANLNVFMEPIYYRKNNPRIFALSNYTGLTLAGVLRYPKSPINTYFEIVFCKLSKDQTFGFAS